MLLSLNTCGSTASVALGVAGAHEIEIGAGGRLHFLVHPSATNGVLLEICQDPIAGV